MLMLTASDDRWIEEKDEDGNVVMQDSGAVWKDNANAMAASEPVCKDGESYGVTYDGHWGESEGQNPHRTVITVCIQRLASKRN